MNTYTHKENYTELRINTPTVDTIFLFDTDIAKQMEKMGNWLYSRSAPHTLRYRTKDIDVYVRKYFGLSCPRIIRNERGQIVDFRNCKKHNNINNANKTPLQVEHFQTKKCSTHFVILSKIHIQQILKEFSQSKHEILFLTQTVSTGKIETHVSDTDKRCTLDEVVLANS